MLLLRGESIKAGKTHPGHLNEKDCLVNKSADSRQLISAVSLETVCMCVQVCVFVRATTYLYPAKDQDADTLTTCLHICV